MDSMATPATGLTLTTLPPWVYWFALVLLAIAALFIFVVIRKGRPLPGDHVFRASRFGHGNRLLPSQVVVTKDSVTFFQPQWIGKLEESIHINHVSSIKIDTHLFLSDVAIETTGGRDPILCHGHTKHDAVEMKRVIEKFQSDYYGQTTVKS